MDNQQVKSMLDLGWLVGFLEGEGCFCLRRQPYPKKKQLPTLRPEVSMTSTDFELSERAARILGELGFPHFVSVEKKGQKNFKPQLCIHLVGIKRCQKFLPFIIPYMTDSRRKRAAELLLEFCNYRLSLPSNTPYTEKEWGYRVKLSDLNGGRYAQNLRDLMWSAGNKPVEDKVQPLVKAKE